MKKRYVAIGIAIVCLIGFFLLRGLGGSTLRNTEHIHISEPSSETASTTETTQDETRDDADSADLSESAEDWAVTPGEGEVLNPLTGLPMTRYEERRSVAVVFDNFKSARPQASLIEADVAFEVLAEGLITRYLGIFYGSFPEKVGAIRSARPYLIQKAMEFQPYFVHVGGSPDALRLIRKEKVADIDGLSSGALYRTSHRKAPHNTYAEMKNIIREAHARGYLKHAVPLWHSFYTSRKEFEEKGYADAVRIRLDYRGASSAAEAYYTSYTYDGKKYLRFTNGAPHVDEESALQLYADNVIVQFISHKVLDKEGRLEMPVVGSGRGLLFQGGKVTEVRWEKTSSSERTVYYDKQGEVKLIPGKTWVQLISENHVTYE